ncbi:MAG TPA: hypothetical protein VF532_08385 [Candidatus Angelobacter sp.]
MPAPPSTTNRLRAPVAVWVIGGLAAMFIFMACLLLLLASLHLDVFSIGGRRVTPEEWMRVAAPLVAMLALGFCVMLYGMVMGRRWWRLLLVLLWCVVAGYGAAAGLAGKVRPAEAWRAVFQGCALATLSWWFLYRTQKMRDYFRSLS